MKKNADCCPSLVAQPVEVVHERLNFEMDVAQPHPDLGVAVGWQIIAVNERYSDDREKLVRALKSEKGPFQVVFRKVSSRTVLQAICVPRKCLEVS